MRRCNHPAAQAKRAVKQSAARQHTCLRIALCVLAGIVGAGSAQASPRRHRPPASHAVWVCAYYLAGQQDKGPLTPEKIDYAAFSHLIHFGVFPGSDGSLDPEKAGITLQQSAHVVALAHHAHRKVLVCMGTDEGGKRLHQALTDPIRPTLVRNLVQFVVTRGYDGLDIDMEPIEDADTATYERFIYELRAGLRAANPKLLLTAATAMQPALFGRLQSEFDQINLMTYDLSGPWPGFKSWYNAALHDAGSEHMDADEPYPSVQGMVEKFVQAGVEKAKLGIGVAFYGYLWTGVNGPKQPLAGVKVNDDVSYFTIMDKYYQPERYHWDEQALAPYLSLDAPLPAARQFVSYDDETLCAKKIQYVRQAGLGGVIIWELGEGYRDSQPKGHKDALLKSIKQAWRKPVLNAKPL